MHTADYLAYDPSTGTVTVSVQLPRERVGITLRFSPAPVTLDLAALLTAATEQGIADGLLPTGTTLAWAPATAQGEEEE